MSTLTQQYDFHVETGRKGLHRMRIGPGTEDLPTGRVPRVSKLMALAIRFDGLVQDGQIESYAALARLGHVTPARITQIMGLLNLAPDIIESLLHLPMVEEGRDPLKLQDLFPMAGMLDWKKQRVTWKRLTA